MMTRSQRFVAEVADLGLDKMTPEDCRSQRPGLQR